VKNAEWSSRSWASFASWIALALCRSNARLGAAVGTNDVAVVVALVDRSTPYSPSASPPTAGMEGTTGHRPSGGEAPPAAVVVVDGGTRESCRKVHDAPR